MMSRRHYWNRNGGRPTWSFAGDMRRLQQDMDFLFGGTRGPIQGNYPRLNAWINDEGLVITAEIAGVDPDDIQLSIENETLTLSGSRKADESTNINRI